MKNPILIFINILFTTIAFGQTLEAETISWGGSVIQNANFGGSTLGEYVITSNTINDGQFLHGFQLLGEVEVSNYPFCLNVTSTSPFGSGSLREAVACSFSNDVITFDLSLQNQKVLLATPTIVIDKPLTFTANGNNVTLENQSIGNSQNLLEIYDPLVVNNLKIIGKSENSLIIELFNNASIEMNEGELDKLTINH